MIDNMPKKLPQYVFREINRHKKAVYYFRIGKGKRSRLPDFGAPNFNEEYQTLLAGLEPTKKRLLGVGSLEWLIKRYRDSSAYLGLSDATRRQRDNIFKGVIDKAGHVSYKAVSRKKILQGREDRAATPAQARNFLDAMRGLFRWALEAEHVAVDPTAGVKNPSRPKGGDGFAAWTDDDVVAYEARWAAGTKERVWFHVLLYTGLRRGDAVTIGRQHVRDGVATLKTEKTGMEVNIPILPALADTLAIGPTGDLAFIVGDNGQPLTKETFGNYFRSACNAAGVKKSAHGVRKIGATRAANAGATVAELEALFGWTGGTMASHYTKTADRKRLAKQASEKIVNAQRPHLPKETPRTSKKS
ncbi:site-specific recombinase XerD [Aminobacter aminovorans]|uniref:Site-specific tyrosine recombinase XerC n=1 Tax=Aminobacter aminovorans TaxID=83263 RepID=A0A380WM29_AMIAI|nr:tyrosine-type recombinase/integrase [Aminobacter aminovorans]TCS28227.1 site-specific recombinase XerD [Aminobacter aminovorans]SUU89362.1 site-specific tyrosine recombinase XerC [Aminobacter aminovorans]